MVELPGTVGGLLFLIKKYLHLYTSISQNMHSVLPAYKLGHNQKTSDVDDRTSS